MKIQRAFFIFSRSLWKSVFSKKVLIVEGMVVLALGASFCKIANSSSLVFLIPLTWREKALARTPEKPPLRQDDALMFLCQQSLPYQTLTAPQIEVFKQENFCFKKYQLEKLITQADIKDASRRVLISEILQDTPMEKMANIISRQPRIVSAFLVGIALKESGLGRHAPHKNGKDCYNYWGYKGNINLTAGGYSCFSSPQQAVAVVGKRIANLVQQQIDTPQEMIIWKCGSSCKGHSPARVASWINDVSLYFNRLN